MRRREMATTSRPYIHQADKPEQMVNMEKVIYIELIDTPQLHEIHFVLEHNDFNNYLVWRYKDANEAAQAYSVIRSYWSNAI